MKHLDLKAESVVAGGDALARDAEGRVVFVTGALPGERVRALVTEERGDFSRAVAVEIVEASPDRVAPPCAALAAGCGGCTWQHVAREAQGRLKASVVTDALRRIARLQDPPPVETVPLAGPPLRTSARLGVTAGGRAGHRSRTAKAGPGAAPSTPPVVEADACAVAHPLLEELITGGRYPGAGEVLLRVGVASGERLVRVGRGAREVEVPAGVVVVREGDRRPAFVHEEVAGRRFRVSVGSFFQSGPVVAEALTRAVSTAAGDLLGPGDHLVDLYAGVGLFASVLGAQRGARVTAVERPGPAVRDARANLADLDAVVVGCEVGRWQVGAAAPPAAVVVADPARSGLGRPGVAAVRRLRPQRLVLVSCDPASLARDVRLLHEVGFQLSGLHLVEAFADTFHVETVASFDDTPGLEDRRAGISLFCYR
ncbi:MAG: class I SAM-dependent RNA methyltransferase [Actinobacteria bacterium]|nr:class I SAM-dependent RNA methyltransferase [Actinomycetota bacterium]